MKLFVMILLLTIAVASGKHLCPANSHYVECGSVCPITCEGLVGLCTEQCVEGCECNDGYIQNGDVCMEKSKCPTPKPKTRHG